MSKQMILDTGFEKYSKTRTGKGHRFIYEPTDQAVDLRVKQFMLYRNKDKLQVDTKGWKAFVSALELVNHFIDEGVAAGGRPKSHQGSAGLSGPSDFSGDKACFGVYLMHNIQLV